MPDPGIIGADPYSQIGSQAPGLPPIDLPQAPPTATARQPLRVTVRPDRIRLAANGAFGELLRSSHEATEAAAADDGAWAAGLPDFGPGASSSANVDKNGAFGEFLRSRPEPGRAEDVDGAWGSQLPDHSPELEQAIKVGQMEAFGRSVASGATYGADPALQGLVAAGQQGFGLAGRESDEYPLSGAIDALMGAGRLFNEKIIDPLRGINPGGFEGVFTGDNTGPATKAYRQGRDEAEQRLELAREQHPLTSFAGEMAGGLAVPIPGGAGLMKGASLATRVGRGAAAGAAGGALYGAGSGISKGEDLGDIAADTAENAATGAGIGAVFHGALGPRRARPPVGAAAAQTARDLGAPLPRGVTSDSPSIQSLTSRLRQMPFAGSEIGERVQATQAAAGRRIENIASGSSRVPPDRALAGSVLRPAIQSVIEKNNGEIDNAYNYLRSIIESHKFAPVTNTKNALYAPKGIIAKRRSARMANPEAGLQDIISLVNSGKGGASFDGLQRARNHLAQVIEFAKSKPNPGFDVADLRRVYAALSADMTGAVEKHAKVPRALARSTLDAANRLAEMLIDRNGTLQRVLNIRADERLAGSLITAAQQKTGNLRMLAELKAELPPDDFEMIAGSLLTELGHHPATGEFSLNKFVTEWDKINDSAKQILFSPQHLQNIEDIVGMGRHIKGALAESSTSHSNNMVVVLDMAKDAALLGGDIATSGHLGFGTLVGGGTSAGLWFLTHWLASPAKASSIARWARTRQALAHGVTAGRLAAFNFATRNMANALGISVESIARHDLGLADRGSGRAAPPPPARGAPQATYPPPASWRTSVPVSR